MRLREHSWMRQHSIGREHSWMRQYVSSPRLSRYSAQCIDLGVRGGGWLGARHPVSESQPRRFVYRFV